MATDAETNHAQLLALLGDRYFATTTFKHKDRNLFFKHL